MKLKAVLMTALLLTGGIVFSKLATAQDTIKVGVLHSLSGTMAISETTLKDTILMMIDEQNKKGGVLGKKLEAVVVDPASNWPLFAEKAAELLELGVAQVGAAGVREGQRPAVLPGAVRRGGILQERDLHRRGAESTGDPGGGIPDEGCRCEALGAGRHRLRLSAHHQQDPAGFSR